jgi:uncharacterized membrane protein YphA (DoxX/SURF4 family)
MADPFRRGPSDGLDSYAVRRGLKRRANVELDVYSLEDGLVNKAAKFNVARGVKVSAKQNAALRVRDEAKHLFESMPEGLWRGRYDRQGNTFMRPNTINTLNTPGAELPSNLRGPENRPMPPYNWILPAAARASLNPGHAAVVNEALRNVSHTFKDDWKAKMADGVLFDLNGKWRTSDFQQTSESADPGNSGAYAQVGMVQAADANWQSNKRMLRERKRVLPSTSVTGFETSREERAARAGGIPPEWSDQKSVMDSGKGIVTDEDTISRGKMARTDPPSAAFKTDASTGEQTFDPSTLTRIADIGGVLDLVGGISDADQMTSAKSAVLSESIARWESGETRQPQFLVGEDGTLDQSMVKLVVDNPGMFSGDASARVRAIVRASETDVPTITSVTGEQIASETRINEVKSMALAPTGSIDRDKYTKAVLSIAAPGRFTGPQEMSAFIGAGFDRELTPWERLTPDGRYTLLQVLPRTPEYNQIRTMGRLAMIVGDVAAGATFGFHQVPTKLQQLARTLSMAAPIIAGHAVAFGTAATVAAVPLIGLTAGAGLLSNSIQIIKDHGTKYGWVFATAVDKYIGDIAAAVTGGVLTTNPVIAAKAIDAITNIQQKALETVQAIKSGGEELTSADIARLVDAHLSQEELEGYDPLTVTARATKIERDANAGRPPTDEQLQMINRQVYTAITSGNRDLVLDIYASAPSVVANVWRDMRDHYTRFTRPGLTGAQIAAFDAINGAVPASPVGSIDIDAYPQIGYQVGPGGRRLLGNTIPSSTHREFRSDMGDTHKRARAVNGNKRPTVDGHVPESDRITAGMVGGVGTFTTIAEETAAEEVAAALGEAAVIAAPEVAVPLAGAAWFRSQMVSAHSSGLAQAYLQRTRSAEEREARAAKQEADAMARTDARQRVFRSRPGVTHIRPEDIQAPAMRGREDVAFPIYSASDVDSTDIELDLEDIDLDEPAPGEPEELLPQGDAPTTAPRRPAGRKLTGLEKAVLGASVVAGTTGATLIGSRTHTQKLKPDATRPGATQPGAAPPPHTSGSSGSATNVPSTGIHAPTKKASRVNNFDGPTGARKHPWWWTPIRPAAPGDTTESYLAAIKDDLFSQIGDDPAATTAAASQFGKYSAAVTKHGATPKSLDAVWADASADGPNRRKRSWLASIASTN